MFSFFIFIYFIIFSRFEVLRFIFIVEKDKNKVLKFDMMYFPYFKISTALFQVLPSNEHFTWKIQN